MTGMRPSLASTASSMMRLRSSWESAAGSPVVPVIVMPCEPLSMCHSTSRRNASSSILPFLKGVTSGTSDPVNMPGVLSSMHGDGAAPPAGIVGQPPDPARAAGPGRLPGAPLDDAPGSQVAGCPVGVVEVVDADGHVLAAGADHLPVADVDADV